MAHRMSPPGDCTLRTGRGHGAAPAGDEKEGEEEREKQGEGEGEEIGGGGGVVGISAIGMVQPTEVSSWLRGSKW